MALVRQGNLSSTPHSPGSIQVSRQRPIRRFLPLASLLVAMLFWNYFLCVTTDPGRVPDTWVSLKAKETRNAVK
jgi:hypothetical protein